MTQESFSCKVCKYVNEYEYFNSLCTVACSMCNEYKHEVRI